MQSSAQRRRRIANALLAVIGREVSTFVDRRVKSFRIVSHFVVLMVFGAFCGGGVLEPGGQQISHGFQAPVNLCLLLVLSQCVPC